jgi:phosphohistidine phosphatase
MKRILLLRHAKSSWDDDALSDHDRPLAPRGRKAAALIAEHLREVDLDVELVLCSSARRARETLERLGTTLGSVPTSYEDGLYGASEGELLERLRRLPEEVGSVAMIGHNPGLHDLAIALTREGRKLELFPTGALATLVSDGPWPELASGHARLEAFVIPKDLR